MNAQAQEKVRIRMYNVGFGDCFLILLPGDRTMLVDAGFHMSGVGKFKGNELAQRVIADVKEMTGKERIDVVVATHRHQDHVYSFNSNEWNKVEVGEVWLPWVDDPENTEATSLWKKKTAFAMQLSEALPAMGLDAATQEQVDFMLWNAGIDRVPPAGLLAAWSNAGALERLNDGFRRRDRTRPRFLPESETYPEEFETAVLPGVRAHVLGPARDPDLIEHLDPTRDGETYRTLALLAAEQSGRGVGSPFGDVWKVPDPPAPPAPTPPYPLPLDADAIKRLEGLARTLDPVFAAEALDDMINSTSLVLVLQVGRARLLLPGDAEWGTWKMILGNAKATALLKGATFFKVGHHGSHNATPKTLVEEVLAADIPAMISTQQGPGNYRKNIPLQDLLTALQGRGIQAVRSDMPAGAALPAGFEGSSPSPGEWIDLELAC
jgi:beta-lactamase superfamily II metal-dependent hydrolase